MPRLNLQQPNDCRDWPIDFYLLYHDSDRPFSAIRFPLSDAKHLETGVLFGLSHSFRKPQNSPRVP
jgi:hypothetical protein